MSKKIAGKKDKNTPPAANQGDEDELGPELERCYGSERPAGGGGSTPTSGTSLRVRKSSGGVGPQRKVLVCVDHSENSRYAFEWFLSTVLNEGDQLVLVHCPEPPSLPNFSLSAGLKAPVEDWMKILTEANAKTEKLRDDYQYECMSRRLKYKWCCETTKQAGDRVCQVANQEGVNFIVMGTRGESLIKRLMLGSVSHYIITHAGCACLVVPPPPGTALGSRFSSHRDALLV